MKRHELRELAAASVQQHVGAQDGPHEPVALPPPQSPWLLASEAAAYLRYASVAALYDAIPTLNIPCHRRGGKTLLFNRAELDAWIRRPAKKKKPVSKLSLVHDDRSVEEAPHAR